MKRKSLILLVATAVTLGLAQPATADDAEAVTASETAEALASVPGVLASSDAVSTTSDANSAATSTVNGTTVDAPRDASDGVTMQADGAPAVKIELPNADDSATGAVVAPGTVAYPATNGAANAVQATENGGVRMLTVIDSADAPTEYGYKVEVPGGGTVTVQADGTAVVLDSQGQTVTAVDVPWAKDANGAAVPTRFTTDGQRLVQHVDHQAGEFAYPVTADPFWVAPAVIVAAFQAAVYACGLGYLAGAAWQIFWNGWVWTEVRRAGREGCVEGVVARFIPVSWFRKLIKR